MRNRKEGSAEQPARSVVAAAVVLVGRGQKDQGEQAQASAVNPMAAAEIQPRHPTMITTANPAAAARR